MRVRFTKRIDNTYIGIYYVDSTYLDYFLIRKMITVKLGR